MDHVLVQTILWIGLIYFAATFIFELRRGSRRNNNQFQLSIAMMISFTALLLI